MASKVVNSRKVVVSAAMGIAGEVVQHLEFAEDSHVNEVPRAGLGSSKVAILRGSRSARRSAEWNEDGLITL